MRLPEPLPATLRPSFDRLAKLLGLIPPGSTGMKPSSTTLPESSANHFFERKNTARAFTAAEFDYF